MTDLRELATFILFVVGVGALLAFDIASYEGVVLGFLVIILFKVSRE